MLVHDPFASSSGAGGVAMVGNRYSCWPAADVKVLTCSGYDQCQTFTHNGAFYQVPVGKTAVLLGYVSRNVSASGNILSFCSSTGSGNNGAAPAGNAALAIATSASGTWINHGNTQETLEGLMYVPVATGRYINIQGNNAVFVQIILFIKEI